MRWKSYLSSIAVIFVLRSTDLYITYLYTPDLSREWNPLVSLLGASWPGLILVQIIIVAFVSWLMFFYFNRTPTVIEQKGLSFHDFIYVYFFGKLRPWPDRLFSRPMQLRKHLIFNGFLFLVITTIISCFAIANNLLLIFRVDSYISFIVKYYRTFFPLCLIGVTIAALYLFFGIEYAHYKRTQKQN